ncbi:MAG: hypothetical protein LBC96_07900 [Lachnospiraceae bacterium]|jgi:hypothetical protein|nr:hypothetical protein [Lachnospiraceae bacterium]
MIRLFIFLVKLIALLFILSLFHEPPVSQQAIFWDEFKDDLVNNNDIVVDCKIFLPIGHPFLDFYIHITHDDLDEMKRISKEIIVSLFSGEDADFFTYTRYRRPSNPDITISFAKYSEPNQYYTEFHSNGMGDKSIVHGYTEWYMRRVTEDERIIWNDSVMVDLLGID